MGRPILARLDFLPLYGVAISRDGTPIASDGCQGNMRRWDASRGEAIGESMDRYSSLVTAVVISDDGRLIITASRNTTVRRWDAITGKAILKPTEEN